MDKQATPPQTNNNNSYHHRQIKSLLIFNAILSPYVGCASTESHSPPLTASAEEEEEEVNASAEHDVNVAEPLNVKSPDSSL